MSGAELAQALVQMRLILEYRYIAKSVATIVVHHSVQETLFSRQTREIDTPQFNGSSQTTKDVPTSQAMGID